MSYLADRVELAEAVNGFPKPGQCTLAGHWTFRCQPVADSGSLGEMYFPWLGVKWGAGVFWEGLGGEIWSGDSVLGIYIYGLMQLGWRAPSC